jgi:ABC-type sugar transport system substrate-binding protein
MERGRFPHILCIAICIISFSACSARKTTFPDQALSIHRSSGSAAASSVDSGAITITRRWRIAFIPKFKLLAETGHLSSYWEPAWEGARDAGKALGVDVELLVGDARGNDDAAYVEPQIALVDSLTRSRHFDGLVLAPFDSNRLAPVVDEVVASGIATVVLDTPVNTEKAYPFVTFDNLAAGRMIGACLTRKLGAGKSVLILDGPTDEQNAVDRLDGLIDGLQAGGLRILDVRPANWEVETARTITAGWLKEFGSFEAIAAANDNMAIGAAEALEQRGRKGVLVTGFDATEEGIAALRAGRMAATVDQQPRLQARLAVRLLIRRLEGANDLPHKVSLEDIRLLEAGNL